MFQTHRIYIKADTKMLDLIKENPRLLLLLEHLDIDFVVNDKTVAQVCTDNAFSLPFFLIVGNLYNGFQSALNETNLPKDILGIIRFLKNSHIYYKTDKYPEIIGYITELQDKTNAEEVKLIKDFFMEYFNEVLEHLNYEESTAFPYFVELVEQNKHRATTKFSANDYREHHTDIETKLADLKNLLLKYIPISDQFSLRRKLFLSLHELEYDLKIHILIEEKILLPLIDEIEKGRINE